MAKSYSSIERAKHSNNTNGTFLWKGSEALEVGLAGRLRISAPMWYISICSVLVCSKQEVTPKTSFAQMMG